MFGFSDRRLAWGLGGELVHGAPGQVFRGLSTDTRTLKPGDAFLALRGPRFDGEKFYGAALKAGAGALIGRKPPRVAKAASIRVPDGLRALQALAADQRRLFQGPVLAITGSNGKTGVKECLAQLLGGAERVLATPGNWNNHVGLPLTILTAREGLDAWVLELGMNHYGELARLGEICRPSVALELNVGDAHLEFFKNRRGVARAKEELLTAMGPSGVAVLNADDPLVREMGRRFRGRILSFGRAKDAGLRAVAVEDRGALGLKARVTWEGRGGSFRLPQGGRARLYQALAALAGSLAAGGDWKALLARLDGFRMASRGRQQLEAWKGAHVLLDTYNASPQSMDAALELLETSAAPGKRVAALGDMLELGRASARLHRELGRRAARAGLKALAAMGPQAPELLKGFGRGEARAFGRNEAAEAARWLAGRVRPGDWVLMKGSRGMAVERIFQAMKEA